MTQLSHPQRRNPALALAGVAIAASMLGGIVGGVVGPRVQAMVESAAGNPGGRCSPGGRGRAGQVECVRRGMGAAAPRPGQPRALDPRPGGP